jgi:hypothetical protein
MPPAMFFAAHGALPIVDRSGSAGARAAGVAASSDAFSTRGKHPDQACHARLSRDQPALPEREDHPVHEKGGADLEGLLRSRWEGQR